jgi:glyoxylase-like metal-dependent hydrolase (beta-lactamase superfamily II)
MSHSVHCIDLEYKGSDLEIISFIVESSEGPIVVETGPHVSLDKLTAGLEKLGYKKEDVKHVLLTHIHLDHGGGAWCFAEHGANVYLHPLGYKHMHDPTRLLDSAKRIYGEMMDSMWGTLKPIAAKQLYSLDDGERLKIGDKIFTSWHTPGHAKHHIAWQLDNILFAGDLAGIKRKSGAVIPPTPPPDIDIDVWISQINRMLAIDEIDTYYVTHGGLVADPKDQMARMKDALISFSTFIKPYVDEGKSAMEVLQPFIEFASERFRKEGMEEDTLEKFVNGGALLADIHGIMRYWTKKLS